MFDISNKEAQSKSTSGKTLSKC